MPTSIILPEWPTASQATTIFRRPWARKREAIESHPTPHPAFQRPTGRNSSGAPQLPGALLVSLMLHLAFAAIVASTATYTPVMNTAGSRMNATLAQASVPNKRPAGALPIASASNSPRDPPQGGSLGPPQQPARFLTDPDLSVLEEIPTTFPGTVSLRLNISALGNVERVNVIRADPVPKELIDGLIERFGKAKLAPAMMGLQAVASTIEVTIRIDPPAQFFDPAR